MSQAGANSINSSGGAVLETLTGNSGVAVGPDASHNINTVGTGSITVVGNPGTNTLTTELTGLTLNSILFGQGTTTIGLVTAAANSVLTTNATNVPTLISMAANGDLLIGSAAGPPIAGTLTAGTGISITNGANSITIAATGSEMAWTDEAISFPAVVGNGYFITGTATATLPAAPTQGQAIAFIVATGGALTIQANTGQVISIGSANSAAAGTAANNAIGDSVLLIYRATSTTWRALSVIGTFTVT